MEKELLWKVVRVRRHGRVVFRPIVSSLGNGDFTGEKYWRRGTRVKRREEDRQTEGKRVRNARGPRKRTDEWRGFTRETHANARPRVQTV